MSSNVGQKRAVQEKLEILRNKCKESGLKLTHQRLEIFRELISTDDHPSAERIHKHVQARIPSISLDTVYRTLSTFERYGLIDKVCVFEDRARFCGDPGPHYHLFCTNCKSIADFSWDSLDRIEPPPEAGQWGRVHAKRVILEGICSRCLREVKP
jgi:Fur family transcriptional regulator, peroxide stress response regulator